MAAKSVSTLLARFNVDLPQSAQTTTVTGLSYDSRTTRAGDLFFALPGQHVDGHEFVGDAVRRGAVGCVHSQELREYIPGVCYVRVQEPRRALSVAADNFYDAPSSRLTVVGVTGTDGKSSTVYFIHQLLEKLGFRSGFLSTVAVQVADRVEKNRFRQSTPEAPDIHGFLAHMVQNGKEFAVVEATSHGLSMRTARLANVRFAGGVLTNISHEHLEFHGSVEQYRSDKANLFRWLQPRDGVSTAVLNANDGACDFIRSETTAPVVTYGLGPREANIRAELLIADMDGSTVAIYAGESEHTIRVPVPGGFQIENALAAATTVSRIVPCPFSEVAPHITGLRSLPGRMTSITNEAPFRVIVDYAHTPGSFESLLPFVRRFTPGRVIALFGSAGERDVEKRAIQGRIAARYCDEIYLSDEDPRLENRENIIDQIADGVCERGEFERGRNLHCIPDRDRAIRKAIAGARDGDTVLLLGKGHESSIIYSDGPKPWDEIREAAEAVVECGYDSPHLAGTVV